MRINGKSRLACNTKIGEAAEIAASRGTRAIVVEPMGNMPVLKDLVVDMDAVHWKKIRASSLAHARRAPARARVHRARRGDDRRHPGDGVHQVRRLRLGLPLARGRPDVHRAGRAGQGLPLRGRPARRARRGAPARPCRGPARHVRLHPLLRLRGGLPQGRQADEPDHEAAPARRRATTDQDPTTATATAGVRRSWWRATARLHESELLPRSFGGKFNRSRSSTGSSSNSSPSVPDRRNGLKSGKVSPFKALMPPQAAATRAGRADLQRGRTTKGERDRVEPVHRRRVTSGDRREPRARA